MASFTRQIAGEKSAANDLNQLQVALEERGLSVNDPIFAGDIAATITAAGVNGHVVIPPGTYNLTASLTPLSGQTIEGAGVGATVLQSPASPTSPVFDLSAVSNVTLRGFSLAIPSGTASSNGHGIWIKGLCSDILIEDVSTVGFVNGVRIAGAESGSAANAVQTVRIGGAPTGGSVTLGFWPIAGGALQTTAAINHNATAATVQTELEALAGIGVGNVAVSGGPGPATPWTITFQGTLAGLFVQMLRSTSSLTGGTNPNVSVEETTRGGGAWVSNPILRRVTTINSPSLWGIHVDDCTGLVLDSCISEGNWLDGVKLRKFAHNTTILGGRFNKNGRGLYLAATPAGGDGIDTYAGGEFLRALGPECNDNFGNGIQIKNDDGSSLSGYGSGKFGLTRKIELIGVHACRNQWGSGLALTQNSGLTSYAVTEVTVSGGLFEENSQYGALIQVRRVLLDGAKFRRNRDHGIYVHADAKDVTIDNCSSIANGNGVASVNGTQINGTRVRVIGGIYKGADDDALLMNTDDTTLTKYHYSNINVGGSDVEVRGVDAPEGTNFGGRSIQASGTNIIIDHSGTLVPGTSLLYGSPGSTYRKTDATDPADLVWIKYSGAASAVGVWRRAVGVGVVSKSADYPTTAVDDMILVTAGATDKTITLPTAVGIKGIAIGVVRVDGAAGNVIVDGNGTETILKPGGAAATTATLGNQGAYIKVVSDNANWVTIAQGGTVT